MKTCSKCGVEKEESEFHKCNIAPDGLDYRCKKCKSIAKPKEALQDGMKRCTVCKDIKPFSDFGLDNGRKDGLTFNCKTCQKTFRINNKGKIAEQNKKYREQNKEKIAEQKREYYYNNQEPMKEKNHEKYLKNRESVLKSTAKWQKENPAKRRIICKRWVENNPEARKASVIKYEMNNKEKINAIHAKYRKEKSDIIKINKRKYRDSEKGKNQTLKERDYRRGLGHNPLNKRFKGCEEHHLRYSNSQEDKDNDMTIYVPKDLHQSIKHNGNTGKNMREINILLLEWYLSETPADERNKKAVDLYLKYCMLPEPVWKSEQDAPKITNE